MKNRIAALCMGVLMVAPAYGALSQAEQAQMAAFGIFSPETQAKIMKFANYIQENQAPIKAKIQELFREGGPLETIILKLAAGDFEGLKTYLRNPEHQPMMNLAPAIQFLRENILALKPALEEALAKLDITKWPFNQLSDVLKQAIAENKQYILNKLYLINDLKNELDKEDALYYADLNNPVKGDELNRKTFEYAIDKLQEAANTPQYKQLQAEILNLFNFAKDNVYEHLRKMNFEVFKPALENVAGFFTNRTANPLDLEKLFPAVIQLQKIVDPVFESFKTGFELGLKVERVLGTNGLPADIVKMINMLKENRDLIVKTLNDAKAQVANTLKLYGL